MHINNKSKLLTSLACVLALVILTPALAQQPPEQMELGKIEGTDMLRDEFRARGLAQLAAIALNALSYYEVEGEYPADFYGLRNSPAWNLEVSNIFTGRPIQAVYYQPSEEDLTTAPPLDVIALDIPPTPVSIGDATDESGSFDPEKMGEAIASQQQKNVSRVDPRKVVDPEPGDVFYYVAGGLIQLVIFAPDGTFAELVDESPNRAWLSRFRTNAMVETWPVDLYASEVLFYLEELIPQYYNLISFMGDRETTPRVAFGAMGGDELILIADELGITPLNPITKDPLTLAIDELVIGDLVEPDPAVKRPLMICLPGGRVLSLANLKSGAAPIDQELQTQEEPGYKRRGEQKDKPGTRPMGGRS